MANDSKKVSQLTVSTGLSANDRLVVLTNPTTSAQTKTISVRNLVANSLTTANSSALGVVKIGSGLSALSNGTISVLPEVAGTYNITYVDVPLYYVTTTDTVIFASPNAPDEDRTNMIIVLPISQAIEGRTIIIKNTDTYSWENGATLTVTTQEGFDEGIQLIEDPDTGILRVDYELPIAGSTMTVIHDGTVWRIINTLHTNPIFYSSTNSYHQVVIHNDYQGTDASADLAIYNNIGLYQIGAGPFIDMGIVSSTYSNSLYTLYGHNDGYLYVDKGEQTGGNLVIGTSQDTSIIFHANGLNTENKVMVVNSTYLSVNTAMEFNVRTDLGGNAAFTQTFQTRNSWEVYPEDDDTGPYPAWAWIRAELPDPARPVVFIENKNGATDETHTWAFQSNGALNFPGFKTVIANGNITLAANGSIGSEGGFRIENATTITANTIIISNNVYDDLLRPLLNPNALDINADGGTSTSVFAIRDEAFTGGGSTTVFGRYEAALDGGVSFNNRHSASYIDGGGANVL